jgi:hypothetical protein
MDRLMAEVLDLQKVWTAKNTDAMERRGAIIRREMPQWLRERRASIAASLNPPEELVGVEGRDGTGLKTEVAWTRVYATDRSPSATSGWYVVYYLADQANECSYPSTRGPPFGRVATSNPGSQPTCWPE